MRTYVKRKTNNRPLAVKVAKDVLWMIKHKKLIATASCYMDLRLPVEDKGKDLQELIMGDNFNPCRACGIGAVFLGLIKNKDNFEVNDTSFKYPSKYNYNLNAYIEDKTKLINSFSDSEMRERLSQAFTQDQISLIEQCFEGWDEYFGFGQRFPNSEERLIIIMKNIKKNKGILKGKEIQDYRQS